jgi:hypothetical protein
MLNLLRVRVRQLIWLVCLSIVALGLHASIYDLLNDDGYLGVLNKDNLCAVYHNIQLWRKFVAVQFLLLLFAFASGVVAFYFNRIAFGSASMVTTIVIVRALNTSTYCEFNLKLLQFGWG